MVAGLELGRLPAGVGVRGPVEVPELRLRRVPFGVHVEREGELEELLRLVPVDLGVHLQPPLPRRQRQHLGDSGGAEGADDPHRGAVVAGDDLVGVGEVGARVAVELVDVPGVPHVREVGVELEQVARPARGDRLAVGGDVVRRDDQPPVVDLDAQQAVVEDVSTAGARGEGGAALGGGRGGGTRLDAGPVVRGGVEDQRGVALAGQGAMRGVDDPVQLVGDPVVGRACLTVHPGDGRAGQDVVELVQQDRLPDAVQVLVRVGEPRAHGRRRRPQLGLPQQVFAAAVALLGLGLAGEGGAVQFEVQLADPDGRLGVLGLGLLEEGLRGLPLDRRRAFEVAQPGRLGDHLAGGAAASVAPAGRGEGVPGDSLVLEVLRRVGDLAALHGAVVGVYGREVGEDPGAVDALPAEGVVRELVRLRPGDLLRQQVLGAGRLDDLRQSGREPEGVREPRLVVLDAELVEEEPLPVHELPGHRLRSRHVGVRLHPHAAGRHEPAVRHGLLHSRPHLGPVVADPRPLLGLRHGEDEVRLVLQEGGHVGGRAGHLAHGLAQRPQPRRVDVRVPDRADAVRGGDGGGGEDAGEAGTGLLRSAVHVLEIDGVQRLVDGAQDLPAARRLHRQLGHQLAEDLQVEHEVPDRLVEHREIHAGERVLRLAARGVLVAEPRGHEGVVVEDDGVGGGLDVQADLLAALGGGADAHPLVARVEALHRGAVGAVDQALALEAGHVLVEAEIEDRLDGPPGPLLRHGAGDAEPAGTPGSAPAGAHLDGLGVGRESFGDRHGLAGGVPHRDVERHGLGVHGGADALVEDALETGFDQVAVVMHAGAPGSVGRLVTRGGSR